MNEQFQAVIAAENKATESMRELYNAVESYTNHIIEGEDVDPMHELQAQMLYIATQYAHIVFDTACDVLEDMQDRMYEESQ